MDSGYPWFMFIGWIWASIAAGATPLCDLLLTETPRLADVQAALVAGDDPNEACLWRERVPMSHTTGGFLAAVLLPVISWPIVFTEDVNQKRSAWPLALAAERLGVPGVRLLLAAGTRPYDGALEAAIVTDRWEIARLLIDAGAEPVLTTLGPPLAGDLGRLAKLDALGVGLERVTSIEGGGRLLTDPATAQAFLDRGLPAEVLLTAVVPSGRVEVLDRCIPWLNPNDGRTYEAMREAALHGRWDLVGPLREIGVPWEMRDHEPVLVGLVDQGSVRDVERALADGADPTAVGPSGNRALDTAVGDGRADLVQRLLDAGAPVDARNVWGRTALAIAAGNGRIDLVELLIARQASVVEGAPLAEALGNGELAAAGLLIAAGAPADDDTLKRLIGAGNVEAVRYLLASGVSPNRRLGTGESLVVIAVRGEDLDVVRTLVAAGATLDGDSVGTSALRAAIERGDPAWVGKIVALGADPAQLPTDGLFDRIDAAMQVLVIERFGVRPPPELLVDAARSGDAARVGWLLAHRADPNGADRFGRQPIAETDDPETEALLLAAGAVVPAERVGRLVWMGGWPQLERLGVRGAALDPFLADRVDDGDGEAVDWLLAHGADPDAMGDGRRPLVVAAERDDALVVRLLAAGASPTEAAMVAAVERGSDVAVEALLAAGAPYDRTVAGWDVAHCRLDRLEPGVVSWAEVRRVAREAGCAAEVRRILR